MGGGRQSLRLCFSRKRREGQGELCVRPENPEALSGSHYRAGVCLPPHARAGLRYTMAIIFFDLLT